jgi:hypothetical protein
VAYSPETDGITRGAAILGLVETDPRSHRKNHRFILPKKTNCSMKILQNSTTNDEDDTVEVTQAR